MRRHTEQTSYRSLEKTSLWTPWGEQSVPVAGEKFAALRKLAKRIRQLRKADDKPLSLTRLRTKS